MKKGLVPQHGRQLCGENAFVELSKLPCFYVRSSFCFTFSPQREEHYIGLCCIEDEKQGRHITHSPELGMG